MTSPERLRLNDTAGDELARLVKSYRELVRIDAERQALNDVRALELTTFRGHIAVLDALRITWPEARSTWPPSYPLRVPEDFTDAELEQIIRFTDGVRRAHRGNGYIDGPTDEVDT